MANPDADPLAFDDVVIDFAGRRLLRDGVVQPLEPKAFAVLALLAGSPGHAFSRDEILDAVWGHRHTTPGVLNRVMTLLRQALGEDAQAARYLHTLHGVGYRFDLPASAAVSAPTTTPPSEASHAPLPPPPRRAADTPRAFPRSALWGLPLLVLTAFACWALWPRAIPVTTESAPVSAPATERSIAVLPLANASRDPEQQFFSDGLSDNLIDALSRFDGLRVIGRMSSNRFRDSTADSKAIGAQLGAAYLVNGSVQHADGAVRIGVELVSAADGRTLWAEHYDRPYRDLFALQDEISSAIARALQAKLLLPDGEAKQGDRPPNGSLEAYSAYLHGLKYWHDLDWPRSAEYMTQAVQLDPGYAMAWAHLSGALSTAAVFSKEAREVASEHMHAARLAAENALHLAPGLGAAHAARAYLQFYDFDYPGALAGCRRAMQLAPHDGTVLNGCGYVLAAAGELEEALRLRERLLSIEPLYTVNRLEYADLLLAAGRLDDAMKSLRFAQSLSQPASAPPYQLMYVAIARGDARAAQEVARQQRPAWRDMNLAVALQISPDRAAADAALAHVLANEAWVDTSPYLIAQAYALRNDADQMIAWLERTRDRHDANLHRVLYDPLILRFRDDPRLVAFCGKVGLPPPGESRALSIDQIHAGLAANH